MELHTGSSPVSGSCQNFSEEKGLHVDLCLVGFAFVLFDDTYGPTRAQKEILLYKALYRYKIFFFIYNLDLESKYVVNWDWFISSQGLTWGQGLSRM